MPGIVFAIVMLFAGIRALFDGSLPRGARQALALGRIGGVALAVASVVEAGPSVASVQGKGEFSPLALIPYLFLLLGEIYARVVSEIQMEKSGVRLVVSRVDEAQDAAPAAAGE